MCEESADGLRRPASERRQSLEPGIESGAGDLQPAERCEPFAHSRASPAAGTCYGQLWETLSPITVPLLLARGMRPDSVLDDDERELLRLPSAQVIHVEEAGHSPQGDTPLELAAIIEHFVFSS